ncbi:MAG: acyl-CoA desaturase [Microscillaceae bacterium]|jgi:linoleoyl-CoA desaturase|nr:acyl-CoA desaturase [Microscillaceae bacterium]
MKAKNVKFNNQIQPDILPELKRRVTQYLTDKNLTAQDSPAIYFKVAFWLVAWVATYVWAFSGLVSGIWLFLVGILHGLTHVFIAFNIAHDANHNAISRNLNVNRLLSYTLDLIGVSSYLWRVAHNQDHHGYVNVEGVDSNIEGYGLLRLSPEAPYKSFHRYQYLYAPLLYSVSTINYVLAKDFKIMRELYARGKKVPTSEIFSLFASKLFYMTYMLILPMVFLPVAWYYVVLCFITVHVLVGNILALTFIVGHLTEEAHFPEVEADGKLSQNWAIHVYETTNDFATKNAVLTWFLGGINVHVIHHLLPYVNHTHYRSLVPIIKQTALDFDIPYHQIPSFSQAIVSHFKFLYAMGLPESVKTATEPVSIPVE